MSAKNETRKRYTMTMHCGHGQGISATGAAGMIYCVTCRKYVGVSVTRVEYVNPLKDTP